MNIFLLGFTWFCEKKSLFIILWSGCSRKNESLSCLKQHFSTEIRLGLIQSPFSQWHWKLQAQVHYIFCNYYLILSYFQKQPFRGFLRKRCSENMQQNYRRSPMPKCDFNNVAFQLYWNRNSAWMFCKFAAYFQNTFS